MDSLLLAHWRLAFCSSLFRKERTLIPQRAEWQSAEHGLAICINEIAENTLMRFFAGFKVRGG